LNIIVQNFVSKSQMQYKSVFSIGPIAYNMQNLVSFYVMFRGYRM